MAFLRKNNMNGVPQKKPLSSFWGMVPVFFFIGFSLVFYFYLTPEQLVSWLGVSNAYLFIFILAFLGGLTTFSGVPYHIVLVTLAIGGLNPVFLGLVAACAVMLGDSTSYYVGRQGGTFIPEKLRFFVERWYALTAKHPRALPVFCFLYGSCVPFSNDFIVISAGIARYPFWRVMIPLGLGNIIFNISLAFLAQYAYSFLKFVFL